MRNVRVSHVRRAHAAHVLGRSAQRTTILCLAILAALVAVAQAKPRIDVGSHTVGNSPLEIIDVYVTGGDPLQGVDMLVSIADEGNDDYTGSADSGEPKIVSVDIVTRSVFGLNSTWLPPGAVLDQYDQVWHVGTTTGIGAVPADGKIFTIILDTTGVAPGTTWPLRVLGLLQNHADPAYRNLHSNYSNWFDLGAPFDGTNGSFTIGPAPIAVPEPSSVVLAALAVLGLAAWGLARRFGGREGISSTSGILPLSPLAARCRVYYSATNSTITALAFCALLGFAPVICTAASYTVTDLGTLGGGHSIGTGINASGHVVGVARTAVGEDHAFLYDGTMHDLGTLGGGYSVARGINDSGQVTGYSYTASGPAHAFLYDGAMHDLGTLGGNESWGYGINESGQVTGSSTTAAGARHAFLYDGTTHDLGTLGGSRSEAYAINASGQVTGGAYTAGGYRHAFLYDGATHDLGTLGGGFSQAYGINASGQVTGSSTTASGPAHAFLYDGAMHDLGTLGGTNSFGYGINTGGYVVGASDAGYAVGGRAFLHDPVFGMMDLNSLISPSSGWILRHATAINDAGQITGWGKIGEQSHAFLLTPSVPEPGMPRIDVGSHTVGNSPLERIDVFVTGDDPLLGVDMFVSIADQGNNNGDSADPGEPKIVSVDLVTGTVFGLNSSWQPPGQVLFQSDQVWQVGVTTAADAVAADGKIFTITLDTTGVAPGSTWALRVLGVLQNWGGFDSNYSNWSATGVPFEGSNGTFTIGPTHTAPEPGGIVLAALAVVGLAAWGMAKRFGGREGIWRTSGASCGAPARRGPRHPAPLSPLAARCRVYYSATNRAITALAFCALVGLAPVVCPAASYTVTDLGTLGGSRSVAYGINASGHVTGSANTAGNDIDAFLYDGTMHDLGTLGGRNNIGIGSIGYGINASGQVTGYAYTTGNALHAFLYDGTTHDLETLGGSSSIGYGINDSGQVTGDAQTAGGVSHAFLYDGTMHDLGTLGGSRSEGYAINAGGQVTGYADTVAGGDHAFLYDGTMHDLGTLGGSRSVGYGINASGQVTGYAYTTGNALHAFLYDGTMHDLGTLGGSRSYGRGINASGQVTGYAYTTGDVHTHAFLYDTAHGMVDLNSLISPSSGWTLVHGYSINDAGQIAGHGIIGGIDRAFLLTPVVLVPEPASAVLAAAGLASLMFLARRRWLNLTEKVDHPEPMHRGAMFCGQSRPRMKHRSNTDSS